MHGFLLVVESLPNGSNIAELATAKVENVQMIYIYIHIYILYIADNVQGKMFGANPGFRKYVVFRLHRKSNGSNS